MYGGQLFGTRNSKFFGKYKKYKILLFQVQPPRVYNGRGDLTEVFCITSVGGFYLEGLIHIHEGLIFGILRYN